VDFYKKFIIFIKYLQAGNSNLNRSNHKNPFIMSKKPITRRDFITRLSLSTAGMTIGMNAISAPVTKKVGANDKIRVGFIGIGNRGSQLMGWFRENSDVEVTALCDVYEPYIYRDRSKVAKRYLDIGKVPRMGENLGKNVQTYTDFRKMLEQKDIDAVCIATPDHWHAVQTIIALGISPQKNSP
jgi:NADH/NAD ratio-sensing transcriptional regulator Rex